MAEQRKTTFTSKLGRLLENLNRTSYGTNEVIRNALATTAGEEELDVIGSFKEGVSLRSKTTASDWIDYVIGEASSDNIAEKIGRGVASFALDVFTDPLTYVGIGGLTKLGRVAKMATGLKTAKKAIAPASKIGQLVSKYKKLGDEVMDFESLGTHGLQKSAKEIAETQATRGQRALLTFMGASVLPKGVNKAVLGFTAQAGHFMRNMPVIKGAIDDAEKLFKARTGIQPFDEAVQRYKGALNMLADKHVSVLTKIEQRMKGLREKEFESVQDYIYGKTGDYNKQVKEVGDELKTFFDDLAKQEQEKGVLKATIDHYLPGIATDDGLKIIKRFATMADKGKSEYAKGLEFAKKKLLTKEMTPSELNRTVQLVVGNDIPVNQIKNEIIDTLSAEAKKSLQNIQDVAKMEGIKDVKQFFHTDPAVLARRRAMASATAIAKADFLKETKKFGMKTAAWRNQADTVKAGWRHVNGVPEFKDMMFPDRVAGALERYHKPLTNIAELNKVIKGYKGAIDFWKRWTLSIFPEYHVRNMVGNYWNNYVVAGITDPKIYARAALVMENGLKNPQKLAGMKIATDAGETITGDALWREMQETNLLNTGMMTHETADHYLKQLRGTPNPATKFREAMQKGGEKIENGMKVAHYMTQRMRGMSPMDANLSAKAALFDYSELTDFERNVLRYIFPFYSWTKFNLPTQIKGILSQPGKYTTIAKGKEEFEKAQGTQDAPTKWMPEWMRDSFPVIVNQMPTGEQYKVALLMSWLPAGDLEKMLGGDQLARFAGSSLEPFSKEALQQLFGKDFYLEKDIENYPGEMTSMLGMKMPVRLRHVMRSFRLLNFVDQLNPGGVFGTEGKKKSFAGAERDIIDLSPGEKAFKHVGGVRLYPYDVEKGRTVEKSKLGALTTKMKYQLKSAERKGNAEKVKELRKKIEEIEKKKRED